MAFPFPRLQRLSSGVIVAAALALLVALLWLPFGLNVGFTGDDWIYFHQADAGILMLAASPLRLFLPIPWIIAYGLIPGTFAGINLFLALLIFGKSLLVLAILRRLKTPLSLAFAAAVLAILLPADTGIFYMGALAIHFAVFCYLLALLLLMIFWQTGRFSALLGMWIALVVCVGIYEVVYPLILFSPLVLLLFQHRVDFRFIRTALLWYVAPALYAIWYLWIILNFPRAFIYQSALVQPATLPAILLSLLNIYKRHFFDGWLENLVPIAPTYWLLGLLAGAVVFVVSLRLRRNERPTSTPRLALIFALSGLAIVLLGVALYLPTSVRDDTVRTFYFSSIGAALSLAAAILWLSRQPLIASALLAVFAGLGLTNLLAQHRQYLDYSERQQALLVELAARLPQLEQNVGVVIVDESPDLSLFTNVDYLNIEYMTPMLYRDYSLEAELCLPGDFGVTEAARCRFTVDGLVVPSVRTRYFVRPYAQLIFVRYDGAFSVVDDLTPYTGAPVAGYQPERLYDPAAPLPTRVAELFGD